MQTPPLGTKANDVPVSKEASTGPGRLGPAAGDAQGTFPNPGTE